MAADRRDHLTPVDAAAQSGFCLKTIYRAIQSGELVAHKVRSRWVIREDDFERWLFPAGDDPGHETSTALFRPGTPPERGSLAALRAIEQEAARARGTTPVNGSTDGERTGGIVPGPSR